MVSLLKKILDRLFKKKLGFPSDFAIVDYSPTALEHGISDDINKVIIRYSVDRLGNQSIKKFPYTPERVYSLKNTARIPIFDKTESEQRFPIFNKILPSEAQIKR